MSSGEFRSRLSARAARAHVELTSYEIDQLEQYFRLLARWNRTINLTSLPLEPLTNSTLDRLLVEPLEAAPFAGSSPGRWLDLGSGGGSPAIPLRILRPQLALTMVESRERKAAFLREAVRDLTLDNVEVLGERFETLPVRWPSLAGLSQLVTVRAVRIDAPLLAFCRWLLAPGGRLFLFGVQDIVASEVEHFESKQMVQLRTEGSRLWILTLGR